MTLLIIQICRADTAEKLQTVVGSALAEWAAQGYTKVNVDFVAPGEDRAGVYLKTTPTEAPTVLWKKLDADFSAVLVLTKPPA